jgi:hypothetical protein
MHLDAGKRDLPQIVEDGSSAVYAYIMSSVVLDGDNLLQTGTGPNFQGGYITLCTASTGCALLVLLMSGRGHG